MLQSVEPADQASRLDARILNGSFWVRLNTSSTKETVVIFRRLLFAIVVFGLCLGSFGCDEETTTTARAATAAECRVVKNGTPMTSPISGKAITKQTNTPAALYDGKLFFFCCEVDRDKFVTQPSVFASGVLPPNGRVLEN
jgi:YHS domain-containing protein